MSDLTVARSTPEEANRRAGRIRSKGQDLYREIVEAYQGRDWEALGYDSWDNYLTGEFGHAPLGLPREERPTQVASLREQGLSLRAIAAVTGANKDTVMSDLRKVSENRTPDPDPKPVTGVAYRLADRCKDVHGVWIDPEEEAQAS